MSYSFSTNRLHAIREGLHAMRRERDMLTNSSAKHSNRLQKTSNHPVKSIKNTKSRGGGGIQGAKRAHFHSMRNKHSRKSHTCKLLELEKRIFKVFRGNTFKKRLK